jgi:membrane dipeptidase
MTPIPFFDGHNDTLLDYTLGARKGTSFFERSALGHIDFPRLQAAHCAGGFFAVFSPSEALGDIEDARTATPEGYSTLLSSPRDHLSALKDTLAMAALLFQIERESSGQLKVVRSSAELSECLSSGTVATIFHIEGAEAIDSSFESLELLYQAGLRSLGIVWSRQNAFGTGVPFSFPASPNTGDGLTPKGKALVKRCNELGIMLDLSHLTEKGFWDVAALSNKPLVATHSNVHALSPSSRNLTDDQLKAVRDSDGMVGLNFAVSFLRKDGRLSTDTPLTVLVSHIDYLVDKLGIDRVGLGSDFDGAKIPDAIGDITGVQQLFLALREAGYDQDALEKIAYKNWQRVLAATWAA